MKSPTSNWGMTQDQVWEMEETKQKFQLPEMAQVHQDTSALKGKKFDQGKPRMDLLPPLALYEISKVLAHGAGKYGDHNWRGGFKFSRLIGATLRHITAWISGETNDPESGFNHLAHAACSILMLLEFTELDLGEDDRWKK